MPHVNELHEQHDPILIVSLASGDFAPADRDYATARSLVGSCADCARLHDDVLALASATKALPPAKRTRDFRISSEQAAKLRPAGLRGLLGRLAAPGGLFSPQLGAGLATLGVAGLLIGSLGSINLGMAGSAATPSQAASATDQTLQAAPAGSPAASLALPDYGFAEGDTEADSSAAPYLVYSTPSSDQTVRSASGGQPSASPAPVAPAAAPTSAPRDQVETATAPLDSGSSGGPSPLVIVSTVLLVAGALVLLGRLLAHGAGSR